MQFICLWARAFTCLSKMQLKYRYLGENEWNQHQCPAAELGYTFSPSSPSSAVISRSYSTYFFTDSLTISCRQTSIHQSAETINLSWGHLSHSLHTSLLICIHLTTSTWMCVDFCWGSQMSFVEEKQGQPACLLQSKLMNSGWELQRKQRVALPTSVLLNLNKSPTGGVLVFCSSYRGDTEDSSVLKVKTCPSSNHTTICHVHLTSFKVVQRGNLQTSVLNCKNMYIPHVLQIKKVYIWCVLSVKYFNCS